VTGVARRREALSARTMPTTAQKAGLPAGP
jgi:hypothetical protein